MPSGHGGSHGGGGSHFSGGSHGGRGYSSRPIRPIVIGNYYVGTAASRKISSLFSIGAFFLMAGLFAVLSLIGVKSQVNTIISDRARYLEMIENAEENPEYLRTGTISNFVYNEDYGKYYFNYVIKTDDNHELYGYSYTLYTIEEYENYKPGTVLTFACDSSYVTLSTDSIDLGYKNYSLNDDAEYVSNNSALIPSSVFVCAALGGGLLLMLGGAITLNKNKKEKKPYDHNSEEKHCPYCGSVIAEGATKCPVCEVEF